MTLVAATIDQIETQARSLSPEAFSAYLETLDLASIEAYNNRANATDTGKAVKAGAMAAAIAIAAAAAFWIFTRIAK